MTAVLARHTRAIKQTGIAAVLLGAVLCWPVTTRQSLNHEVTTHRLPLYLKATNFIERSAAYERLADQATSGANSDEARVLQAFAWTREHIRPFHDGLPLVDDHILNIVERGYGMPDQQADVFATLCTYAGVPAFWKSTHRSDERKGVLLTYVRLDGRWRVFDVAAGVVFRGVGGTLLTLGDLYGRPQLVPPDVASLDIGGVRYADLVSRLTMPAVPHPLRAELQMPSRRLWHELKATAGIEPRYESE